MKDANEDPIGGHYVGKVNAHKIMRNGLWWPTIFRDTKEYFRSYDVCQHVRKSSRRDEIPLNP